MGHVGQLIHDHGEAGNIKSCFSGLEKNVVIYKIKDNVFVYTKMLAFGRVALLARVARILFYFILYI